MPGLEIARGRCLGELGWEVAPFHIATDADDDCVGIPGRAELSFGEQTGKLSAVDDQVVRPLEQRANARNLVHCLGEREPRGHRHDMHAAGVEPGAEQDRDEQRRSGRCVPSATAATPPGGLMVSDADETIGRTAPGLVEHPPIGRVELGESDDVPAHTRWAAH